MNFGMTSLAAPKGCVVEGCQILLHGAARRLGIIRHLPLWARYGTLLVGIRRDQAGIDGKAFTADQPSRNAIFNHPLEDLAEQVAVAEPFIAGATER